jgi:hypothetical protein
MIVRHHAVHLQFRDRLRFVDFVVVEPHVDIDSFKTGRLGQFEFVQNRTLAGDHAVLQRLAKSMRGRFLIGRTAAVGIDASHGCCRGDAAGRFQKATACEFIRHILFP